MDSKTQLKKYAAADINDIPFSLNGYTEREAEKAIQKYGKNELKNTKHDTILYRLKRAFVNPFTVVLFILAIISASTDILLSKDYDRSLTTPAIMFGMLIISGIIRFAQEMRSKKISDRLLELVKTQVSVKRNGEWKEISSEEITVGDIVRFNAGDRIPADIRLTKADNLFVSQSVITGESNIVEKNADMLKAVPDKISDYENIAFSGTTVIGGYGEGIVIAIGKDTVYGGISPSVSAGKSRFDSGANSIAWVLIRFMAILVPVVFIAGGFTQGNWITAFLFALSVAVGLTPEMLPMVINACLAKGSSAMEKKQTIVRNINAMQSFGCMDVLCMDKTGTLTGDKIVLEYYMDILGNECRKTLDFAYLNSIYTTSVKNHLDDAITSSFESAFSLDEQYSKIDEFPFDYERKISSVLVNHNNENLLIIKGSVEEVCKRCRYAVFKDNLTEITGDTAESVGAVVNDLYDDGMKVLAVAYKPATHEILDKSDETDLILLGYLAFFDAPKKTASAAIEKLKSCHVAVKVLTGDSVGTSLSVCKRLRINTENVLTGSQIDAMSPDEMALAVERTSLFAEISPKQKAEIIGTLQNNGHTTGFLGDGMNDLPAMTMADVGISVDTSADAIRESADVILLKKDLNVLEQGIVEGRKAFANMSKYIRITASSNFGNIFSIVIASILLPFFPMTSVQILLLNLLYDTLCLVLPWDNVDKEICDIPQEWSGKTLGRFMRFFGPVSTIFDLLTFAFLFFVLCPELCGGAFNTLSEQAQTHFISLFQTGWFLESMWSQVLIIHLLRTKKAPFISSKPSKYVSLVTVVGVICFTVMTFTPLGEMIGLTAMPVGYFAFLIAVVIAYMILVTVVKSFYVKKYNELT